MFGGKTQTHKYEYDVDNKNTVYIDALNRRIENTYDENANKIKTTMPNGSILESVYDSADRATSATDSRGGKIDWEYHDKANSKTEKLKEQTVTQGGYTNKVSYD